MKISFSKNFSCSDNTEKQPNVKFPVKDWKAENEITAESNQHQYYFPFVSLRYLLFFLE